MIIDLASLGTTAKKIEVEFDPQDIDLEGELVQLQGAAVFDGEIEKVDEKATVSGSIKAHLLLDCTRCLELIDREVDFAFRAVFVDAAIADLGVEAEVSEDALDESLISDGQIDLTDVVREQILLWLPEQIFCSEGCQGLCAKCGANLNLIDCKCSDDEVDPRWAALKSLK